MGGAELMTGGNLSDAMRLSRKFTLRRAMEMAVDCARGLAYLHAKKNGAIIHRSGQVGAVPCRPLASVEVSFPVRDNSR